MDILFYPRKNDATNSAGRCPLYCIITVNSLRCVPFSTGLKIIAQNWNPRKKTTQDELSDTIRQELLRIENNLRKIKINLEEANEPITAEIVKYHYQKLKKEQRQVRPQKSKETLADIYQLLTKKKLNRGASESTKKHDKYLSKSFLDFADKKGLKNIKPSEVNIDLVEDFIDNFQNTKKYLRQCLSFLETALAYSMKKGMTSRNVVKDFIDKPRANEKKTSEIGLELDEIETLKSMTNLSSREQKAVDVFLFLAGTSLDFCDYNTITSENIIEVGNYKILKSERQKTDRYDTTTVCELNAIMKTCALDILEKYGKIENLPRFKFSQDIGGLLKKVAIKASINKQLTTKRARKTFANLSINYEKHTDEQTAYQMGHVDTKQLKNYRKYNENILKDLLK